MSRGPKSTNYMRADGSDPIYEIVRDFVSEYRIELGAMVLAIVWRAGVKADSDGNLWLAHTKVYSEAEREYHGLDVFMQVNIDAWSVMNPDQHKALIDRELMKVAIELENPDDVDLTPRLDDKGRVIYRSRKFDLQQFYATIARWGTAAHGLEEAVQASIESKDKPLFALFAAAEKKTA